MALPSYHRDFLILAGVVVLLDQVFKALALTYLAGGPVTVIPGFFNLVLVRNQGAAFGAFAGAQFVRWVFVAMAVLAVAAGVWLLSGRAGSRFMVRVCMGLIAGGAVGNAIDRIFRDGRVVDFVDWYIGPHHWPVFNLADAGITCGGILLALAMLRGRL